MPLDIKTIRSSLLKAARPELAEILGEVWEMPLHDYAALLWKNSASTPPLEAELRNAFEIEFCRMGFTEHVSEAYSAALERTRVLQTATHLTASEGPTFLALHHLALLGLPPEETYFVGSYSGVPFANAAWSGCLNLSDRFELESVISHQAPGFAELKRADSDRSRDSNERRISFIPGSMRDTLVYHSSVPEKLISLLPHIAEPIRRIAPNAKIGDDFTVWASQFSANQLRQIIPEKSIVYFDLNEVIRNYLIEVLKNSRHPLFRLLFHRKIYETVFAEFSQTTPLFTVGVHHKNKVRHEAVIIKGDLLQSQNFQLEASQENIIKELETGALCPGLFLTFTTLSFINGLICFGSFEQVEYLSEFQRKWLKLGFLDQEIVRAANTRAFTSGRCVDETGEGVHPLDLLLGLEWSFAKNQTVADLMEPLLFRLGVIV